MQNREIQAMHTKQMHRLEHAGFDRDQIDALIDVIGQQVHTAVSAAMSDLVTKDDLANFVTKGDLANFATKDDLANFATKDDLVQLEKRLETKFESKFATRDELAKVNARLDRIEDRIRNTLVTKDDFHKTVHQVMMWVPAFTFGTLLVATALMTAAFKLVT